MEEVKAKVKALFPEDVEEIYISKNDYDRLYGDLTLENIELKQRIDKAIRECEEDIEEIWKIEGAYMEYFESIIKTLKGDSDE